MQFNSQKMVVVGMVIGFLYATIGLWVNSICIRVALINPPTTDTYGNMVPADSIFCHVPFVSWMVTVQWFTDTLLFVVLITFVGGIMGAIVGRFFVRSLESTTMR